VYRGSSSAAASAYKKRGHRVEQEFSFQIGGTTEGLPPQGKTDCKDGEGQTYSVKNHAKKNWQIFLYSHSRVVSDTGFRELCSLGLCLQQMLESYPDDQKYYFKDKAILKKELPDIKKSLGGSDSLVSAVRRHFPDNQYFISKLNLQKATELIAESLADEKIKFEFLKKAFFNGDEVNYLSLQNHKDFHIFEADEVVKCLVNYTSVSRSGTGGHKTDLSLPGQKVLLKTNRNLMELEVRNEPKHYRELRMNVRRDVCFELLDAKFATDRVSGSLHYRSLRT